MVKKYIIIAGTVFALSSFAAVALANNSWGNYHWNLSTEESTANPLEFGDNLTTASWITSLAVTSADWNLSVLKNQVVAGTSNANCDPTSGKVEVCNAEYGNNGWLGIASIWIKRGRSNHITQGVVKLNDTYFNTSQYNTQAWRYFVTCQEVGHTQGLDHQDVDFANVNLGTCMDYTNDPDGTLFTQLDNRNPNQHDYDQLELIYAHLNSTDGDSGPGNGNGKSNGKGSKKFGSNIDHNNPSEWGQIVRHDAQGKGAKYERNLPNGDKLITFVIWAN